MIEPAPGARDGLLFVPRGRDHRPGELEADGDAVDREPLAVAVVGLHERTDASSRRLRATPGRRSRASLELVADHARCRRRRCPRRPGRPCALASASRTCAAVTWMPLMSFSAPS